MNDRIISHKDINVKDVIYFTSSYRGVDKLVEATINQITVYDNGTIRIGFIGKYRSASIYPKDMKNSDFIFKTKIGALNYKIYLLEKAKEKSKKHIISIDNRIMEMQQELISGV